MAARLRKMHQEDVRTKIRASLLVNKLEDHVLKGTEMSATQVSAAMGLLKKVVPDLAAVQHTGPNGGPIATTSVDYTDAPDAVIRWLAGQNPADDATHH